MTMRRGLILSVAVIMSACTEEAAVTPPTATIETTATTEPAPEPTTAITADTTVPETTTAQTTTAVPDTTTAPTSSIAPTGDPTTVSTEYFIGGALDGWLYLGRWTGNDWEADRDDEQQLREPSASSGDTVVIHELDTAPVEGSVDGTAEACSADGRIGPVITPTSEAAPDSGFRSIAFAADWSTEPRPVALVDASIESYVSAGAEAFDDLGIDTTDGTIQQLVVTDLDGDGDSEALVAFGADAFSTLLLIDTDSGAATRVARSVAETVTPTTAVEGDQPGEATTTPVEVFRVLAVADLNGDGRAEFMSHATDGTSATVTVNAYDGTEVDPVLAAGC